MDIDEAFAALSIKDRDLHDDALYTIYKMRRVEEPQNRARLLLAIGKIAEEKNSQKLKTKLASKHLPLKMDSMEFLRAKFVSAQIDSAQPDLTVRVGQYEWKVHSDLFIDNSSFVRAALERDFKVCTANQEAGGS